MIFFFRSVERNTVSFSDQACLQGTMMLGYSDDVLPPAWGITHVYIISHGFVMLGGTAAAVIANTSIRTIILRCTLYCIPVP